MPSIDVGLFAQGDGSRPVVTRRDKGLYRLVARLGEREIKGDVFRDVGIGKGVFSRLFRLLEKRLVRDQEGRDGGRDVGPVREIEGGPIEAFSRFHVLG